MAFVNMKCPSCGGALRQGDAGDLQFECPYCHATILNIPDVQIEGDIEAVDAEDFIRRLNERKKEFVIHVDRTYKVVDVATAVINGKLEQAEKHLAEGKYGEALRVLEGVPADIPAAARMRVLAENSCTNEYYLTLGEGPIRGMEKLAVCDEATAASYRRIEELRMENKRVNDEIRDGYKLMSGGIFLPKEAYSYALKMCSSYPASPPAWTLLGDVKERIDSSYAYGGKTREKAIAQEIQFSLYQRQPPAAVPAECRKEFWVRCAGCGELFHPETAAFVCPACKHEQSNDDIRASMDPGMLALAEQKEKEYERVCYKEQRLKGRGGTVALLCVTAFLLFVELAVYLEMLSAESISASTLYAFCIVNAVLLLAIALLFVRLFRSRAKALQKQKPLAAELEKFGIREWLKRSSDSLFVPVIKTQNYRKELNRKCAVTIFFGALAAAALIGWTLAILLAFLPAL